MLHDVPVKDKKRQSQKFLNSAQKKLFGAEVFFNNLGYLRKEKIDSWRYDFLEIDNIEFLFDKFEFKEKQFDRTAIRMLELITNAKDSVFIDSPYLVPTLELEEAFESAIKRGIYIRILTNSLYSNDGGIAHAAYLLSRKEIAKMGVDLYEYYDKNTFHSKSMVIGNKAVIGSMNLDVRSFYLNKETIVSFENAEFAKYLRKSMDESILQAVKIKKNGRPERIPHRVGPIKYLKCHLLKFTIIERFRHLI